MVAVDVVVDVPAARLSSAYTYLTQAPAPGIGTRVRVPFANRVVGGWIVSEPTDAVVAELKPIETVLADAPRLDAALVALARWMSARYACGLREALAAAAGRGALRSSTTRFRFIDDRKTDDRFERVLAARFALSLFSAVSARRALRAVGERIGLDAVIRGLERLVRAGVVERATARAGNPVAATRVWDVTLTDAAAAKSSARKRIVDVLEAAPGRTMRLSDVAAAASTTPAVIRAAAAAGVCAIAQAPDRIAPDSRAPAAPNADQERAIQAIGDAVRDSAVVLLQGVTGSGKTFVYARAVERVRAQGGRAVVLVPEIALTPQTAGRIAAVYGSRVVVLHSGLSDGERARVWEDAARGDVDVVVGARSAVFVPLPDLRLIIVDEEHEPSYKQDVSPRYDTAAVARERMRQTGGAVVLGSATPSLESYAEAMGGYIRHVRLTHRATNAPLPPVEIVDMSAEAGPHGRKPLGVSLVGAMERALDRGEKTMLFVNRRGYAGLLLCRACGFAPRCHRCSISLVVHTSDGSMRCHVCGDAYRIAVRCPKCSSDDLRPFGFGTQRVEEEVRTLLPHARIVRMDADTTTTRGSHRTLLEAFGDDADVLIGTQMIAKGLDFPTVTVVGVVAADIDLNRPDFRAAERTFSLLTQVAGRAGRAAPGARVVVQTFSPDHYAVRLAAQHDYETFAEKELALRRELRYPPFGKLAYLSITGADAREVGEQSSALAQTLRAAESAVEVLGPAPEPLSRARGEYRMRIAIKADDEAALLGACEVARDTRLSTRVRLSTIIDPR